MLTEIWSKVQALRSTSAWGNYPSASAAKIEHSRLNSQHNWNWFTLSQMKDVVESQWGERYLIRSDSSEMLRDAAAWCTT